MPINLNRRAILKTSGAIATVAAMTPHAKAAADRAPLREYAVTKQRDGQPIKLAVYRRVAATVDKAGPALFLVHGSSNAALSSFDLTVHEPGDYSLMRRMADAGFDVWTMDHEGYGKSQRTDGNSDIASGVADLHAALELVRLETGRERTHLFGESSGALRAAAFAQAEPDHVGRLILEAFTYTGKGSPTLAKRGEQLEFYKTHNRRPRDIDMIRSIFNRDKPGTSDPAVPEAQAKVELAYGDSVPTGTYLDMTAHLPLVDPARIAAPVQLIRGEYDGIATVADLVDFYEKLPNGDRQLIIIPGAAHAVTMSFNRAMLYQVMKSFLTLPAVPTHA